MTSLKNLFEGNGLVAVTGGGGGETGLRIARTLDRHGARVVHIVGRRKDKLAPTAKEAKNGTVIPRHGDISSQESLIHVPENRYGLCKGTSTFLLANAGTIGPQYATQLPKYRHPRVKEFRDAALCHTMDEITQARLG